MIEPLYDDLAALWPHMVSPEDYTEEVALYAHWLTQAAGTVASLLELGCGSGHLASQLPAGWSLTLVDHAPRMLDSSRQQNPQATHVCADMCDLRLGRRFDAVLLQDAVMYLRDPERLRAAFATAAAHLRPGGAFLVLPDMVAESFEEHSVAGGRDDEERSVRMLEWHWDPDPDDDCYQVDFAVLVREADGTVRCHHDQHTLGLFPAETFVRMLTEAGFELLLPEPPQRPEGGEVFLARLRG